MRERKEDDDLGREINPAGSEDSWSGTVGRKSGRWGSPRWMNYPRIEGAPTPTYMPLLGVAAGSLSFLVPSICPVQSKRSAEIVDRCLQAMRSKQQCWEVG